MLLRNLFESANKTAVLGWGRGMGHKGHMLLAQAVIHHAGQINAEPFFVVSRTTLIDPSTGDIWADRKKVNTTKDDPLTPDEKLATYKKVFPDQSHIFSVATEDASTLLQVMGKLSQQGFKNIVLVVGEQEVAGFGYLSRPDKSGTSPMQQIGLTDLKIISRQDTKAPGSDVSKPDYQEGPRATPMRAVLLDPSKSEEEQFAVWRRDMPDNLSDEEVMDLMQKAKDRLVKAHTPVVRGKKAVAEFAMSDDDEDPTDNYPCYDCGSTIFLHHTELCELAEDNAIRDLPANPGSQHWTGEIPKGLDPIPGLQEQIIDDPWGPQGRFAGDAHVDVGGEVAGPKLQVGDLVQVNAGNIKGVGEIWEIKGDQAEVWIDSYARSFNIDLTDLTPYVRSGNVEQSLAEGTSIESTLRAVINDIGEPITSVYDAMKFQAKKYVDNHGELDRGFRMVAAGIGGRWVQNMYVGRLQNELYDLCRYNTRRTVELKEFLRGVEIDGELEMKRSFGNIANNLPRILAKLGQHLDAPQLTKNANRWMQNKAAYEEYIANLEAEDDDYEEPASAKAPKSNVIGQQNVQVDQIVNSVLSKLPSRIQGDIRNAIARAPNKLQALQAELQKRGQQGVATEHIVKVKGGYELRSKHGNKNLGKYPTRAGAEKREREVQYFKHMSEDVENIMGALINQIIVNEAISHNRK
jgi:hypothetical protein